MTPEEANKIIAEYMGNVQPVPTNISELSEKQQVIYQPYAHSLDALVPVWEKYLKEQEAKAAFLLGGIFKKLRNEIWNRTGKCNEVVAVATAKVLQELS